jgi:hypothetical protein
MKFQLGFESHAYTDRYERQSPLTPSVKRRRPQTLSRTQQEYGRGKTTNQVAQELENKYDVVETFFNMEADKLIVPIIETAYADALELRLSGLPTGAILKHEDAARIETRFRRNLSGRKYDGVIRGVPTLTSLRGVSHLRKKPESGVPRPSFIDTGMYQRSFTVWMED